MAKESKMEKYAKDVEKMMSSFTKFAFLSCVSTIIGYLNRKKSEGDIKTIFQEEVMVGRNSE